MTKKIRIKARKINDGSAYGNLHLYDSERQLQIVSDLYSDDNVRAMVITENKETQRYLEIGGSFVIEVSKKRFNRLYDRAKATENQRDCLNKNKLTATGLDWKLLREQESKDHSSFRAFVWNNIGDI